MDVQWTHLLVKTVGEQKKFVLNDLDYSSRRNKNHKSDLTVTTSSERSLQLTLLFTQLVSGALKSLSKKFRLRPQTDSNSGR